MFEGRGGRERGVKGVSLLSLWRFELKFLYNEWACLEEVGSDLPSGRGFRSDGERLNMGL